MLEVAKLISIENIPGRDFSAKEITISEVICGSQGANNVWLL